jgi:uncharacterized repeat protein (TIGR01451 family)
LNDNSKYYFKACAIDKYDDAVEGRVLSLVTGSGGKEKVTLKVSTLDPIEYSANTVKLKGRMEGANGVNVWFVINKNEGREVKCTSSSQKQNVYGKFNSKRSFYKRVNFLESDTKYSFKACSKNIAGTVFSGVTKTFTTKNVNHQDIAKAITINSTYTDHNSAQLNGKVFANNTNGGRVYFMYGKNKKRVDLKTSPLKFSSDVYFQAFVKLDSNTTYYFQTVIEDKNNDLIAKGDLKAFRTKRSARASRVRVGKRSSAIVDKVNVVNKTRTNIFDNLIFTKTVSVKEGKNYSSRIDVKKGDNVYYKIRIVNNSNQKVKKIYFSDVVPRGMKITSLGKSNIKYNSRTRIVSWVVPELAPESSSVIILKMKVTDKIDPRTIVSSTKLSLNGKVSATNPTRIVVNEIKSGTTIVDNGQSASIISSNMSLAMPSSILG